MRYELSRNKFSFTFDKDNNPAIKVNKGDEVVFHTIDAHNGTVPKGTDVVFPNIDLSECNPISGPVYVHDAEPGDVLKVKIMDIEISGLGYVPARNNMGSVKGLASKNIARNMLIKDNHIYFDQDIKIPLRPMIGTIGVAPKDCPVFSAFVGMHGGNMDNNDVKKGSIIYFPVFSEGALLSVGDVHASMGDGELTSGGVDTCAKIVLKFDLIKNKKIDSPIIETRDSIILVSNSEDFYEANRMLTKKMIHLLEEYLGIKSLEAYWLLSICGDLKISQACDCPVGLTLRMAFPKSVLFTIKKRLF